MEPRAARSWLCVACQRGKYERCWGTWYDYLDEQPWVCARLAGVN